LYFHIDLDAFFASVEQVDQPELLGKPLVVGALPGNRGVVSTCSYAARRFGIHSAMPISEAWRRCPQAVFLPVRMARYDEVSRVVMRIFESFTPDVLQVSIDEASLDMVGTEALWGGAAAAAARIKAAILEQTGLTISIGIAANRYVAKLACGLRKPDGLVLVEPGQEAAFMLSLRLADLWGAGAKTQQRFAELGIRTMKDLAAYNQALMQSLFGKAGGQFLYLAARGQDPGIYGHESARKSIGTELTFEEDSEDRELLEQAILDMCQQLCLRLFQDQKGACGVQVKLRYHDFVTLTVQASQPSVYSCLDEICKAATGLFHAKWNGHAVRLIGVSLFNFSTEARQAELFGGATERAGALDKTVFALQQRGLGKMTRARLLKRPSDKDKPPAPD